MVVYSFKTPNYSNVQFFSSNISLLKGQGQNQLSALTTFYRADISMFLTDKSNITVATRVT